MIKTINFGRHNGQIITQTCLTSSSGIEIYFINYGASIQDWRVPTNEGLRSVVLGFNTFDTYVSHGAYFGAIVGRVASRIKGASFSLAGRDYSLMPNESEHMLHGGSQGLQHQVWDVATDNTENSVIFTHTSNDSSTGFPGTIKFTIVYTLRGNRLRINLSGLPDCETPISLAQHNYFNLGQTDTILDHKLNIVASQYTPIDPALIPTGEIRPVAQSKFDYSTLQSMRDKRGQPIAYDINYVLNEKRSVKDFIAQIIGPDDALSLKLYSDRPGLQLYNGIHLNTEIDGLAGKKYGAYGGICLEDQMLPDALNNPQFPSIFCTPDNPYDHWCEIEIGLNK